MDKQIIEEMAKVCCGKYNNGGCEIDGWVCTCKCKYYKMAETLYNKILPENAVVLTREEYDELQIGNDFNYGYHNGESNMTAYYENIRLPEVRKETAERFASLVEFHSVSTIDENGIEQFTISALGLKEILHEEFGIPYNKITSEN